MAHRQGNQRGFTFLNRPIGVCSVPSNLRLAGDGLSRSPTGARLAVDGQVRPVFPLSRPAGYWTESRRSKGHGHRTLSPGSPLNHATLHHAVMEFVIECGYAPDSQELADRLEASPLDVEEGLRALQDYHGVVLHPGSPRIWVVHPFSTAPTNFLVRAGKRAWWAPCAWCALGAAALLEGDVDIVTTLGAEEEQVTVAVRDGQVQGKGLVVHFPVPKRRVWENVVYSCSNMLLFESEEAVDQWVKRHRVPKGDVQPIEVVWELAKAWYGRHLDRDWQKWSISQAREIFAGLGLSGDTWELPDSDGQF